jgi:hypothetical protein
MTLLERSTSMSPTEPDQMMPSDNSWVSNFWNESSGTCDCCGHTTRTIWGDLSNKDGPAAVYFVQWTVGRPDHLPNVDLIVGRWGDGTSASDRYAVSLLYKQGTDGGFMVIDAAGRKAAESKLCGKAMRRDDVIGTPVATEAFALLDALWLTEPRISELSESRSRPSELRPD